MGVGFEAFLRWGKGFDVVDFFVVGSGYVLGVEGVADGCADGCIEGLEEG